MIKIFEHPFSVIICAPSNSGKSTLAFNLIKHSRHVVGNTDDQGFDAVFILYRSYQPLYQRMKNELTIPVYLYEKAFPEEFEEILSTSGAQKPVVIVDDGVCPENQEFVLDLFCRLGHHLAVSVILITQSLFDSRNSTLRLCHRNTKGLIIFSCPRDQGSIRTLIQQMMPDRNKARILLETVEKELEKPFNYILFDFQPQCPPNLRFKTNILCENGTHPVALVFKEGSNQRKNFSR